MIGWIKIHRKIQNHWLWSNPEYFQWWIDILMQCNFEPKKILIKNVLLECNRGECLYSYSTWALRWKCSKSKAVRFLQMLQKDNMVCLKNETVTIRLTVCNYDSYQDERNGSETEVKRKRNGSETEVKPTKERQEEKNLNNTIYTVESAFKKFDEAKISGRYFSKMNEVHGLNEDVIQSEFSKWKTINESVNFNSEKHLQNSFNNWLRNYKPEKHKSPKSHKKQSELNWGDL